MSTESSKSKKDIQAIAQIIFPYLPIIAAAYAILYELGFHSTVGMGFFSIISIYDHFVSALATLPIFIFLFLVISVLAIFFTSGFIRQVEDSIKPLDDESKKRHSYLCRVKFVTYLARISIFPILIIYSFNLLTFIVTLLSYTLILSAMYLVAPSAGRTVSYISGLKLATVLIALFSIPTVVSIGAGSAQRLLRQDNPSLVSICDQKDKCTQREAVKIYSDGVLTRTTTQLVYYQFDSGISFTGTRPHAEHMALGFIRNGLRSTFECILNKVKMLYQTII